MLGLDDLIDEDFFECTPPDVLEAANAATLNLLPEKSRTQYENVYKRFKEWCQKKKTTQFSENVLLAYFAEKSKHLKPSTLWSEYSMVRACLIVKDNVDIKTYSRLVAFLKRQSVGFRPKKSKVFKRGEFLKFLVEAPDETFLMMKVIF